MILLSEKAHAISGIGLVLSLFGQKLVKEGLAKPEIVLQGLYRLFQASPLETEYYSVKRGRLPMPKHQKNC